MIRLAVSVEGQAEEEFVNESLAPHLRGSDVYATPVLIGRARPRVRGGGNVAIERLAKEMRHLSRSFDAVTSLVDFYGFRGKGSKLPPGPGLRSPGPVGGRTARTLGEAAPRVSWVTAVFPPSWMDTRALRLA